MDINLSDPSSILNSRDPFVITRPNLIHAGDFCGVDFQDFTIKEKFIPSKDVFCIYQEEDDNMVNCTEIDDNFDIQTTEDGKFVLKFHVASPFCSAIIGVKGTTLRQLERDTSTMITIPRKGETGDVMVTGKNERDVLSAKNRIDAIIWKARDRHPLTHFISIPMVSHTITHNFEIFKVNILNGKLVRGLDESMFQNPNKLHLTIGVLVLADEIEQNEAVTTLRECQEKVIIPALGSVGSLQVTLKGVEIMNDDPTNVDVLYGKVTVNPPKYQDYFQKAANGIVDHFASKGLCRKQYENVKLHVTVINSLYRKGEQGASYGRKKRETFDATSILETYKHFKFGDVDLDFIHLSVRFTTNETSYYEALTTIPLK